MRRTTKVRGCKFLTILEYFKQYLTIFSVFLWISWAISDFLGSSRAILGYLELFRAISGCLELSCDILSYLRHGESFNPSKDMFCPQLKFPQNNITKFPQNNKNCCANHPSWAILGYVTIDWAFSGYLWLSYIEF